MSSFQPTLNESKQGSSFYTYTDTTGNYILSLENRLRKGKLLLRSRLYKGSLKSKPLEKIILISRVKTRGENTVILPYKSQYKVWLNKVELLTDIKIENKSKSISVRIVEGGKVKSKFSKKVGNFQYLCFFSQLANCISAQKIIVKAQDMKVKLGIIWDNYPYNIELYEGIEDNIVTMAELKLESKNNKTARYSLDLGNQVINYHFDKGLKLQKMLWITQGITMKKLGE